MAKGISEKITTLTWRKKINKDTIPMSLVFFEL